MGHLLLANVCRAIYICNRMKTFDISIFMAHFQFFYYLAQHKKILPPPPDKEI